MTNQNYMTNSGFLLAIEKSFREFIAVGTSRSTRKLVPLHGAIARDFQERLGSDFQVQAQGFANGREGTITGRYMDKKVDITISKKGGHPVGGVAVKFVMQNYAQNANNYFENMLGETANIRSARCPYFQVFIILDKIPYYRADGSFKHWEFFSESNIHKYCVLDEDDPGVHFHSPDKMLLYVVHLPDISEIHTKEEYLRQYEDALSKSEVGKFFSTVPAAQFSNSVILNNYELFAQKVFYTIMAL